MITRTIEDIPSAWRDKLKQIQETFPNAVIAGGCLRDWFQFKTRGIKDIDIFLPLTTDEEISAWLNNDEETKDQIRSKMKNYGNLDNDDISSVYTTGIRVDNLTLEFIGVTVPKSSIMDRFDFGICQIMYDGEQLLYTDQFLEDLEKNKFTLIRADTIEQYDRSVRRFSRLSEFKFPGYTFDSNGFDVKLYGAPLIV